MPPSNETGFAAHMLAAMARSTITLPTRSKSNSALERALAGCVHCSPNVESCDRPSPIAAVHLRSTAANSTAYAASPTPRLTAKAIAACSGLGDWKASTIARNVIAARTLRAEHMLCGADGEKAKL